jgi:hypothetical protein
MNITQSRIHFCQPINSRISLAAEVLVNEVKKRTGIVWHIKNNKTYTEDTEIILCLQSSLFFNQLQKEFPLKFETLPAEGAQVVIMCKKVYLIGADERGLFYAVGRFLRNIHFNISNITIPDDYHFCESPAKKIRGHQLAYRPICNTFDNWNIDQFEQLIIELILFGANAIEILPGNTEIDDFAEMKSRKGFTKIPEHESEATSWPHMQYEYNEMVGLLSNICEKFGLDVMIWYPNLGKFDTSQDIDQQLEERELVFKSLKKLDRLVIPSGDPGELHPVQLFSFTEKVYSLLKKHHPKAEIRLTLQAFHQSDAWVQSFFDHVNQLPIWLKGITISPWLKIEPAKLRELVHPSLELHHYPDITHNLNCQYPVPNWDLAFAICLGREAINPRPKAQKQIHNLVSPFVVGSIGYSEGFHDDLNKFIWLDQDWSANTSVEVTVKDYANFFMDSNFAQQIANGLFALEENWNQPVTNNPTIAKTHQLWQSIFQEAGYVLQSNYRFQLYILRAKADFYIQEKQKLELETVQEIERKIKNTTTSAIDLQNLLNLCQPVNDPTINELHKQCLSLGDSLYLKIGLQLSVVKHLNIAWNRGAFLDTLHLSTTNLPYYQKKIAEILETKEITAKESKLFELKNDLYPQNLVLCENYAAHHKQLPIAKLLGQESDPAFYKSPFINFAVHLLHLGDKEANKLGAVNINWLSQISSRYDEPLKLKFTNLDKNKKYSLEATCTKQYFGDSHLTFKDANGTVLQKEVLINTWVSKIKFTIPTASIEQGNLNLVITSPNGELGPNIAYIKIIELI